LRDDHHLHAVAVLAFKAVSTLETKRRVNDKKVLTLYVEYVTSNFAPTPRLTSFRMKDMMEVLLRYVRLRLHLTIRPLEFPTSRLKDVDNPKQVAPNGQTIEGRMQKLCEAVAQDIEKCANACDTYLK